MKEKRGTEEGKMKGGRKEINKQRKKIEETNNRNYS